MIRVRYIGTKEFGNQRKGQEGTLIGLGQRVISWSGETEEEKKAQDEEFAKTYSQIRWDGNTWPWNCPNTDWEMI